MKRLFYFFFAFFFIPSILHASGIFYTVNFKGLNDKEALDALKKASELILLKKKKPSSLSSLRFRAESDTPILLKVLHNYGYLEATLSINIEEKFNEYNVIVSISPGPLYRIEEYQITLTPKRDFKPSLEKLGICLGEPALAQKILESEETLLKLLANCGWPFASIEKREFIADGKKKSVSIFLDVQTGPLVYFGHTIILGLNSVREEFVRKKIPWEQGDLFNQRLVENAQKTLMDTGLFASVYVMRTDNANEENQVPIRIEVTETKHKSISVGASYQVTFGPSITFGWENKNVSGVGRTLSFLADVGQNSHSGIASFLIPEFVTSDQRYILQLQALHETIRAYHARTYSFFNRFTKEINPSLHFHVSVKAERLLVRDSVENGNFWLLETPIYLKWSSANDKLNPTKGMQLKYRLIPSLNFTNKTKGYLSQTFAISSYVPLIKEEFLILAQKITFGSLYSHTLNDTPVPKRFLGGSEDNLRGYRYLTVSPLKHHRHPEGGRSLLYYTIEPRFRLTKSFGLVPFLDMGSVYSTILPNFKGKWLKSLGLGFRFFSFFGPLRLDLAFPLNRRKHLDPTWWIFVNLGQTF